MYAKSGNNKHVSKMTEPRCPQCGYSSVNDIPRAPFSSKRFQKLISTNECLTGEEKCIFNDFVEDGQSRLSDLDARIALVGNLLEGLKKAKEELETALTERKKILHPMRSIPEELLLEIFKRGLGINADPEDLFRSEWHSLDLSSAPWVYGHVSRRWRVLSMNSPVLWTRIKISKWPARRRKDAFGRSQVSLQTSVCSPLVAYLARSRSSPVAVYLNLPAFFANRGGGEAPRSEEYTAISSILLSHAWRWRSLHLVKSDSLHPLDSTLFSIDTFPSLTNLTTEGINYGMGFSNLVAPQLRSWETIGKPSASFPVAALSAIQYYSSSEAPGSDLLQVVALLPNIRTLCVQSLKPFLHTAWSSILVPTLLIGLTKLEIKPSASASLQSFLNNISCPSLQSLCMGTCDSLLSTTIQSFEMRSRFHLKYWGFTSPLSINDSLQNTGSIETIVAHLTSIQNQILVLSELTARAPPPNPTWNLEESPSPPAMILPCPKLRRLELHLKLPKGSAVPKDWNIVEQIYNCFNSRVAASDAIGFSSKDVKLTPVLLMAPELLAARIRRYKKKLAELQLLGFRVEIVGYCQVETKTLM